MSPILNVINLNLNFIFKYVIFTVLLIKLTPPTFLRSIKYTDCVKIDIKNLEDDFFHLLCLCITEYIDKGGNF